MYATVNVNAIVPSPHNPRRTIAGDELGHLTASIREVGVLEPLIVRRTDLGYELVAGERRWRAASAAGLELVPVKIIVASDRMALELALTENSQRVDVDPFEEARAVHRLVQHYGAMQSDVAERLGRTPAWVARRMRLATASPELEQQFRDGRLGLVSVDALLSCGEETRAAALDVAKSWGGHLPLSSVHQAIRMVTRDLRQAPWSLSDDTYPGGACAKCPRRTLAQLALWDEANQRDDRCLDDACWQSRSRLVVAQAETEGRLVLRPEGRGAGRDVAAPVTDYLPHRVQEMLGSADARLTVADVLSKAGEEPDAITVLDGERVMRSVSLERLAAALTALGHAEAAEAVGPGAVERERAEYNARMARYKAEEEDRRATRRTEAAALAAAFLGADRRRRLAALVVALGAVAAKDAANVHIEEDLWEAAAAWLAKGKAVAGLEQVLGEGGAAQAEE